MNSEKELPLVSIIAVCYNQERFLRGTLDSIITQSYPNIQLVIIDDFSRDNSVETIKLWMFKNKKECTFIAHDKNRGLCATLNEALSHCDGKYFQVIACDDLLLPQKIERQVQILESQQNDVAMVFSDAYLMDEKGEPLYGWFIQYYRQFLKIPQGEIFDKLLKGNFIPAMGFLAKTKVVKDFGGYDENLIFEDYDLWLRIAKKYKILYDNIPSAVYRIHNSNMHKSVENWGKEYFKILKKHIDNSNATMEFKKCLMNLYSRNLHNDLDLPKCSYLFKDDKILFFSLKYKISYKTYSRIDRIIKKIYA